MQLTRESQKLIVDQARRSPLGESEFRHIVELGNMYLAREDASEREEYVALLFVKIDDAPYKICKRISPGS